MLLTGHEGEIFSSRFSGDGNFLASAGYDQRICTFKCLVLQFLAALLVLWNVFGECENFSTLRGHTGAITDVYFSTDVRFVCIFLYALQFVYFSAILSLHQQTKLFA